MSTNVGEIDLQLLLNSGKYTSQLNNIQGLSDKASSRISNSLSKIGKAAIAAFSVAAVAKFGKECLNVATETSNAWIGLNSILVGQGKSFDNAKNFINEYISDGLVPLNNAVAAYKNLSLRGYSSEQIEKTMNALKNSATFARQSTYSLGEAVQTATEGLKNENSVVVDNAGVTKNVAKMWEEYAAKIGTTRDKLTQEQKIQAEVNGILEETKFQSKDAAIYTNTYSGKLAQLNTAFTNLKTAVGNAIQPLAKLFVPVITVAVNAVTKLFTALGGLLALFGYKADSVETVSKGMADLTEQAGGASDAVSNVGDSAKKAGKDAKKASNNLAAFDKLDVLKKDTDSSSGTGSGSGGSAGGASNLDLSGLDKGLNGAGDKIDEIAKKLKSAFDWFIKDMDFSKLENSIKNLGKSVTYLAEGAGKLLEHFVKNCLKPLATWVINEALPHFFYSTADAIKKIDFKSISISLDNLYKSIVPFAKNIGNGLLWFYDEVLIPLETWGINEAVPSFLDLLSATIDIVNSAINAFKPAAEWLFNSFLKPIAEWTGGVIISIIDNLTHSLEGFSDWINENQGLVVGMTGVVGAFFAAWEITNILGFIGMSGGIVGAFNAITGGIIASTKAKLIDKAETMYLTGLYAKDFVMSIVKGTGALVKQAAQWVITTGAKVASTAATIASTAATVAATAATWLFNAALAVLTSPITLVIVAIGALIAIIVAIVKNWDTVSAALTKGWEWIKEQAVKIFTAIGDFLSGIWEGIKKVIEFVWGAIKLYFTTYFNVLKTIFTTAWNIITTVIKTVVNTIKAIITTIFNAIKTVITNVFNSIRNTVSNVINKVKTTISNVLNTIKNIWNKVWTGLKTTVTNIFDGIWKVIKRVINSILGGIEGMANGIVKGINRVIDSLNKIKIDIPDWVPELGGKKFGFDIKHIGEIQIDKLAQGGYVKANTPQLAIVGDNKHQGEIIAPEDKIVENNLKALRMFFKEMGDMKNNNQPINLYLNFEGDIAQLARILKPKLDKESRRKGNQLILGGAKA